MPKERMREMPSTRLRTANNTLEIASLVQALGQPNTGASRVFWDKQTETRGEQSPDNEFTLVIPVNF